MFWQIKNWIELDRLVVEFQIRNQRKLGGLIGVVGQEQERNYVLKRNRVQLA